MFGPHSTEQNPSFVFPPVLRLQRFLIKLSVGNASVTPETQSVLFSTYTVRIRVGIQMTNFPSVIVKPWRSHKSTQGLMYTLMSKELNLTKRLQHHSQAHSQQRTITQHDMLPQHPVNIKELFCECF